MLIVILGPFQAPCSASGRAAPVVSLLVPPNAASVPPGPVELRWTVVEGAGVSYKVYLDRGNATQLHSVLYGGQTATLVVRDLSPECTYFWTVVPVVAGGNATVNGSCDCGIWSFSVLNASSGPKPPTISSVPPGSARVGYEYIYQPVAQGHAGHVLSYMLRERPQGMSIDGLAGTVRWTPVPGQTGMHGVNLTVSEGNLSTVQGFTVNVTVPQAPPPPSVKLLAPADNAVVNWSLYLAGKATTAPGAPEIARVEVKVDSGGWSSAQYFADNGTWAFLLDTSGYRNGFHRLSVRAWDGLAYSSEASLNLTFANPGYVLGDYPVQSDVPLWTPLGAVLVLMILLPLVLFWVAARPKQAAGGRPRQ